MAVKRPDEMKAETTAKQPKPKRGKADALAVHGQYQRLIDEVAQNNAERLGVLTQAMIGQADQQAEQLADIVETLASGHVVFNLTMDKLGQRAAFQGDCPESFRQTSTDLGINLAELAGDPFESIRVFPGTSTAKAIAGV